jgi:hypothetical protein
MIKKALFFLIASAIFFPILYNNIFYVWIERFWAPVFLVSIVGFVLTMYCLFFNQKIQNLWWRWFRYTLLIPVLIILVFLPYRSTGGINFAGAPDFVILWGVVLGIITIIYTFYHRFYLKTGVLKK